MKFKIGDQVDKHLVAAMAHEFLLCQEEFDSFTYYAGKHISGDKSKATAIKMYTHYARFLQHLYEFYIGAFKRNLQDTKEINWLKMDLMFVEEIKKLYRNKANAILKGYAPAYENDISYYQEEIPSTFGESFRKIRNRTTHVLIERASSEFSLSDFFKNYHGYVYTLYDTAMFTWSIKDIEEIDWEDIEKFSLMIKK